MHTLVPEFCSNTHIHICFTKLPDFKLCRIALNCCSWVSRSYHEICRPTSWHPPHCDSVLSIGLNMGLSWQAGCQHAARNASNPLLTAPNVPFCSDWDFILHPKWFNTYTSIINFILQVQHLVTQNANKEKKTSLHVWTNYIDRNLIDSFGKFRFRVTTYTCSHSLIQQISPKR